MSWRDVEDLKKLIEELGGKDLSAEAVAEHLVKMGVVAPNEDLSPVPAQVEQVLSYATTDQLRAEVRRRDLEVHSKQFSVAAQQAIRELEGLRKRIDELTENFRLTSPVEATTPRELPQTGPKARRFAKPDEEV